jgi:hypothetical protein
MEKPSKRKRPASGWPKGWEVIGGDVVDYEAALDFDAVILGRPHSSRQSPTAARESPFDQSLAPRQPEHSEVAEKCHPETVDPRKDYEGGGA